MWPDRSVQQQRDGERERERHADQLPEAARIAFDQRYGAARRYLKRTASFQRPQQLDDITEARFAVGLDRRKDGVVEPARDFRSVAGGRHRLAEARALECFLLTEGPLPGQPAVKGDAKGKLVGKFVAGVSGELLRSHEAGRAGDLI